MSAKEFQEIVWRFGREYHRAMPWRENTDPYLVLVSEIMLQQTQVERVKPKFHAFISRFPTFGSLARSPLADVLKLWSGLGYNRRARFLWLAAQKIEKDFSGVIPQGKDQLLGLPGVGQSTAGAILAYSFNQPVVFIETNIRTVYFNHFPKLTLDKELAVKIEHTMDEGHPHEWYWALMDYGTFLKQSGMGQISQSAHYKKQSPLKGSQREMRGRIIKALIRASLSKKELQRAVGSEARFASALAALVDEQLVAQSKDTYSLAN